MLKKIISFSINLIVQEKQNYDYCLFSTERRYFAFKQTRGLLVFDQDEKKSKGIAIRLNYCLGKKALIRPMSLIELDQMMWKMQELQLDHQLE